MQPRAVSPPHFHRQACHHECECDMHPPSSSILLMTKFVCADAPHSDDRSAGRLVGPPLPPLAFGFPSFLSCPLLSAPLLSSPLLSSFCSTSFLPFPFFQSARARRLHPPLSPHDLLNAPFQHCLSLKLISYFDHKDFSPRPTSPAAPSGGTGGNPCGLRLSL